MQHLDARVVGGRDQLGDTPERTGLLGHGGQFGQRAVRPHHTALAFDGEQGAAFRPEQFHEVFAGARGHGAGE
ncbi:hypothetical protein GCM10009575_053700 [Streptomyces rhizosphaericus]|uniref:Uncharacterized protein n=1 Tax=Streptomyces rhizosphaericus TaxID=114699 RepID=A0ABN1QAT5_9ACTN